MTKSIKKYLLGGLILVVFLLLAYLWQQQQADQHPEGFISGNGRTEATEIDIATKMAGRVDAIYVQEGDFVQAGQLLAVMQTQSLNAQKAEAEAARQQALQGVLLAEAQIRQRESDLAATRAVVVQHEAELEAAQRRWNRSRTLAERGAASQQEVDDDEARVLSAEAAVVAARAQVGAAEAAITAARAQHSSSQSQVVAAEATLARIEADIEDSRLIAPRDGRVQLRLAQPGEVLGAGSRVLNLLDLSDVYMTFFVPETLAGRIALGSEARLLIDAAPGYVIPARVSFVASQAQFTPKTVETASERQKLMFRVRAQISPALLQAHLAQVKTGMPGVAWLRIDPDQPWPDFLTQGLLE